MTIKTMYLKIIGLSAIFLSGMFFSTITHAHGAGATMDPAGTNPHFMAVASVFCGSEGDNITDHLFIRIRDKSPYVEGAMISFLTFKGTKAVSTTDFSPGDADYSPGVKLKGGVGTYWMMLNMTDVGPRNFDVEFHCEADNGFHTPTTDLQVFQFN